MCRRVRLEVRFFMPPKGLYNGIILEIAQEIIIIVL